MAARHRRRMYAMTPGWWVIRGYLMAVGVAALIGLGIGIVWVIAGLVNFHLLR